MRKDVLAAVCAAKMDGVRLCKRIFNCVIARYPVIEEVIFFFFLCSVVFIFFTSFFFCTLSLSFKFPQESERDDVLINAWNWLIYPGIDTYYDALLGMNEIMREFFCKFCYIYCSIWYLISFRGAFRGTRKFLRPATNTV